ncbi:MAG: hypothetical protein U0W24_21555 [Bacteroidales bacterium]
MKNNNYSRLDLGYLILKALEEQYASAEDIISKLNNQNIEFEKRNFYPVLSGLLLDNYLCYNWLEDENGIPEKHFHLTRTGYSLLHK